MTLQKQRIRTVTVDSYSTLLDVDSASGALSGIADDPESVARLWRQQSLNYAMQCNFLGVYRTFYELNRYALDYALHAFGIELSPPRHAAILSAYHHLEPFHDVRDGVIRLQGMGYPVYVLSNGDPDMLQSLLQLTHIEDVVSGVISVHEIRRYKPAVELYRHAAQRVAQPVWAIAHVSAGWFDVAGAMHAGMQGVWMNRKHLPGEVFGPFPRPDLVVDGFDALLGALA